MLRGQDKTNTTTVFNLATLTNCFTMDLVSNPAAVVLVYYLCASLDMYYEVL